MNKFQNRLIVAYEGSGTDGWWPFVARNLQCVMVGKKIVKHYARDYTHEKLATRYLNDVYLTWLRNFHTGSQEDAVEFSKIVAHFAPNLVGASQAFPRGYLPPFAMPSLYFQEET